jgi:hypothetical protein
MAAFNFLTRHSTEEPTCCRSDRSQPVSSSFMRCCVQAAQRMSEFNSALD